MTHLLPPNLLRFFVPPPPLPGLPTTKDEINPLAPPNSVRRSKGRKEIPPLTGVASFLERVKQEAADKGEATEEGDTGFESQLKKAAKPTKSAKKSNGKAKKEKTNGHVDGEAMDEDVKEEDGQDGKEEEEDEEEEEGEEKSNGQKFTYAEQTKRELRRELKKKQHEERRERGLKEYNPKKDPEAVGDPFKTLFLGRLPYSTTEKDLHREFDQYGAIERIRIVQDKEGKSRGYAFVVYEKERDMRTAYKDADGLKLQGRRILVDVERGRTVEDWKPTRLGGGLGGVSRKKKAVAVAPEPGFGFGPPGGFAPRGGGFGRGGFGGRGGGFGGRGGFGGPPRGGGFGAPSGPRGSGGPPGGFRGGYGGGGGGGGFQPPQGSDRGYGDRPAKRGRF